MSSRPIPSPHSYQHARPNVVHADEETALLISTAKTDDGGYFEFHPRGGRPAARVCFNRRSRRGCGLLAPWSQSTVMLLAGLVAAVLVGSLAVLNNSAGTGNFIVGTDPSYLLSASMNGEPEGPPSVNQAEGTYDWQKCQHSDDPDCWKKEGERVGSFWQNFGTAMSTYWSNWGHNMHDYWANVFHHNETETNTTTTTTTPIPLPAVVNTTEIVPDSSSTTKVVHHTHAHAPEAEALAP